MAVDQFKKMELITTKYIVDYDRISVAATTNTHHFHLPSGTGYLIHLFARVTTAFTGVTSPTVKLGTSDDTELMIQKQPIDKIGNLRVGSRIYEGFCDALPMPGGNVLDHAIQLVFDSTAGNLSALSAGQIEFVTVYAKEV